MRICALTTSVDICPMWRWCEVLTFCSARCGAATGEAQLEGRGISTMSASISTAKVRRRTRYDRCSGRCAWLLPGATLCGERPGWLTGCFRHGVPL